MEIRKQNLEKALTFFKFVNDRHVIKANFVDLMSYLHIEICKGNKLKEYIEIRYFFGVVIHYLWNIDTILSRLDWQHSLFIDDKLDDFTYMSYSECDIMNFLTNTRSIFDYIAEILVLTYKKKRKGNKEYTQNFNWWYDDLSKNTKQNDDFKSIFVEKAFWYKPLSTYRDLVVHCGGKITVFLDKDENIAFQIHKNNIYNTLFIKEFMINNYVLDFKRFSGLTFAYMLVYLDDVAVDVARQLCLDMQNIGSIISVNTTVEDWIKRALSSLK